LTALSFHFSLRPVDIKALTLFEFDLYAKAIDDMAKDRG
jgi:hypothetical protein